MYKTKVLRLLAGLCLLIATWNRVADAQTAGARLHGVVTDPSGASVPDALVQLRGGGSEYRARTDGKGQYTAERVKPGTYQVRVIAKGFSVSQRENVSIDGNVSLDVQL